MLIGGLLKVIVHRPGQVRSVLNCDASGPDCLAPFVDIFALLSLVEAC
jgi:hypothetical protein